MTSASIQSEAQREWEEARQKALWTRLTNFIQRKNIQLENFEEISAKLRLTTPRYKGLQDIPLDKIVGSVGRYNDFIATFLPTTRRMEERWERIAALYLDPTSAGVPPIEVYKVGELYFVKDGNHRVSVASQLQMSTIEAYVWEYPLSIDTNKVDTSNLDAMIVAAEQQDFFNTTKLNEARPKHKIKASLPGAYRELLHEVVLYQGNLQKIDAEDPHAPSIDLSIAASAWYDMVFEPSVQIIQRDHILDSFPERTATDLFIWLRREQQKLAEHFGHSVHLSEAIQVLDERQQNSWQRTWKTVKNWVSSASEK